MDPNLLRKYRSVLQLALKGATAAERETAARMAARMRERFPGLAQAAARADSEERLQDAFKDGGFPFPTDLPDPETLKAQLWGALRETATREVRAAVQHVRDRVMMSLDDLDTMIDDLLAPGGHVPKTLEDRLDEVVNVDVEEFETEDDVDYYGVTIEIPRKLLEAVVRKEDGQRFAAWLLAALGEEGEPDEPSDELSDDEDAY